MSANAANRRYTHLGSGLFLITADANQQPPAQTNKVGANAKPAELVRLGLFRANRIAEAKN